jgi:hypothetical protein
LKNLAFSRDTQHEIPEGQTAQLNDDEMRGYRTRFFEYGCFHTLVLVHAAVMYDMALCDTFLEIESVKRSYQFLVHIFSSPLDTF